MRMKLFLPVILVGAFVCSALGQGDRSGPSQAQQPPGDPIANISMELTNISRSVQLLGERLKAFVDKFEKVGGLTLSEKQQRFIMGLELLVRSEQRVATLQKGHSELMEKHIQIKARLTQVDLELKPQNIERWLQLEGAGSQAPEARDHRRDKLAAELRSLQQLIQQVERNIAETDSALREAQAHVSRLRRSLLP